MEYPKISIVTPVYNQVDLLEQTILSLLNQKYPNLEYIIIDGGSTDGTVDIIKRYESQLAYWVSEPDNGMYDAIQKGFEHSTGEIMAWLNSDDMYHKGSLFTIAEIFTNFPDVEWLEGTNTLFDNHEFGGRIVLSSSSFQISKYDFLLGYYHWIQQESTVWRRSLWEKTNGLNTNYKYAGDYALWLSFFRHAKLYRTDALIGGFRKWSDKQVSSKLIECYEEECKKALQNEPISKKDILIIKRYKLITKIHAIFSKVFWFSKYDLSLWYKNKYFNYPPLISYSFEQNRFIR